MKITEPVVGKLLSNKHSTVFCPVNGFEARDQEVIEFQLTSVKIDTARRSRDKKLPSKDVINFVLVFSLLIIEGQKSIE